METEKRRTNLVNLIGIFELTFRPLHGRIQLEMVRSYVTQMLFLAMVTGLSNLAPSTL